MNIISSASRAYLGIRNPVPFDSPVNPRIGKVNLGIGNDMKNTWFSRNINVFLEVLTFYNIVIGLIANRTKQVL